MTPPSAAEAVLSSVLVEPTGAAAPASPSDHRLRLALEAAGMGHFEWDPVTDRFEVDARGAELLGLSARADTTTGRAVLESVHAEDRALLADALRASLEAGDGPFAVEHRLCDGRGAERWLRCQGRAVAVAGGRGPRVVGLLSDVTERRDAQAALARAHAAERTAAERVQLALAAGAIAGTWDWDLVNDRFTIDERFADTFGIDPALGRTGLSLERIIATVHPEDVAGLRAAIAAVIARGGAYSHEYRVRSRDGRWRWIEANGRVDLFPDGSPNRFPGVLLDIEARRALAAERDRAQGLLGAFIEAVPGVVYAKDREGRMLMANAGTAELIGKPPVVFLGRTDAEFLGDPVQAAVVMANDRRIMDAGRPELIEEEVSLPDGRRAVWLSAKAPFRDGAGRIIGLVGASIDITARKDVEERLRLAIESSSMGWWDMDARTREVRLSDKARELFDLADDGQVLSLDAPVSRIHPDDLARVGVAIEQAMAADADGSYRQDYRVCWRDGSVHWVKAVGRVHFERLSDGTLRAVRFVGVLYDITDEQARIEEARRVAEERERLLARLQAREAYLSTVLDTVPVGIVTAEAPSGRISGGNARAEAVFGHAVHPSRTVADYAEWEAWHADGRRVSPEEYPMTRALAGETRASLEVENVRADGSRNWLRLVAAPIRGERGEVTGAVVAALDIDAERRALDALRLADQRKDEFLAMLAHELRNPLAPVLNAVKILERTQALSDPSRAALAMLDRSTRHMKRLVDDLLEVSRITRGKIELRAEPMLLTTSVANVVEGLLPMLEARNQTLEVVQPPRPVRIQADPVRITQILENLLTNASKYTHQGGAIHIEVSETVGHAQVRVRDDGVGLSPEALEQVFELFVQASQDGGKKAAAAGGLGIGLAMVRRLVEMHGGRVWAESEGAGTGSCFVVELPRSL